LSDLDYKKHAKLGIVGADSASRINEVLSPKTIVPGAPISIGADQVRHAFGRHGSEVDGQESLYPTDFELVNDIVNSPDQIESAGVNPDGSQAIKFAKRFNGTMFVVAAAYQVNARKPQGHLRLVTMYKFKAKKPQA